ncbi:MAG: phosphatase PAP2 family protein [Micropruina sp.]|uniref:phosphatase PAP2 family protein n=1 Tax=Micropruina sp. TaxID=2737536 RepID=UPI0039E40BB4
MSNSMNNTSPRHARRRSVGRCALAGVAALTLLASGAAAPAQAVTTFPSDDAKPDQIAALSGYSDLWQTSGQNDLHGTVKNGPALQWNDRVTSWINQNATAKQQFRALQNAKYLESDGSGYDQSISIADGLGSKLGQLYAQGRIADKLPLTAALINSKNGTSGAYVNTDLSKPAFSHPRPYLSADPNAAPVAGDEDACAPSKVNSSSLVGNRKGKPWADAKGNLKITRLASRTDTTHEFADIDVPLTGSYGEKGLCTGGSFPSGHTATAYQAAITLAMLLPELAPEILTRASEAGNNRMVVGVHYSLDIIGGRIVGQQAMAKRWGDSAFRDAVLKPARAELVSYLETECGAKLATCIAKDKAYADNPYGGKKLPGGTSQIVKNRKTAVKVYTERLGYGFAPVRSVTQSASVPAGAESLLQTVFPKLTGKQRRSVLAQTEARSGHPLDTTWSSRHGTAPGSWQRLNLAAAMSARVLVYRSGKVVVSSVGGKATTVFLKR